MFVGLGVVISVEQIETIFGIILLIVQICIILYKSGMSIYKKIKEKKYGEIKQDIDEAKQQIEEVTNKANGREDTKSK